jgi:hypothetical protein
LLPYDELAAEFVAAETKRIREKKQEKKQPQGKEEDKKLEKNTIAALLVIVAVGTFSTTITII